MKLIKLVSSISSVEKLFNNIIGSILLMGMMFLIVCDVAGGYLFNKPIQGKLEVTEFIMAALVFLTLSYTQAIKAHIKVDLLVERVPDRARLILELVAYLLGLMLFVFILWEGVMSAKEAWEVSEVTEGVIPFPTFPAKLTIPIGSFLLCLRFIVDIVEVLKGLMKKDTP